MTYALHITYVPSSQQLSASHSDMTTLANSINKIEGLISKIWIQNKDNNVRGGVYLFDTVAHAEAWRDSLTQQRTEEGATHITSQLFEVLDEFTAMTWTQPAQWQHA